LIYCAAVDKIEERRKPEDFIGHRKRDRTNKLHNVLPIGNIKCPETLGGLPGILILQTVLGNSVKRNGYS
jgi:hypothetical protein